ncbi:LOW QUALITY PROTEIN: fat-like cadherin-related tumor suppressor homolog [Bacillus rossius redtenbacheri]|uniref:LOW QUALITY PROTEIN: fat-like cadherin-related tumor suppressor homolog n=1 Tax=Bacillus rossius redtenbacheri TaxID=93214 RepID=UPI002FDE7755
MEVRWYHGLLLLVALLRLSRAKDDVQDTTLAEDVTTAAFTTTDEPSTASATSTPHTVASTYVTTLLISTTPRTTTTPFTVPTTTTTTKTTTTVPTTSSATITTTHVPVRNDAPPTPRAFPEFKFTRSSYNVSIPENSVGKTFAVPEVRMGIVTGDEDDDPGLEVRYKIVSGDKDKFFKAEEKRVGDFCFLAIRTRTGNVDVLNRERKDRYVLEVRASGTRRDGVEKLEADATVVVSVLDVNDLKPLFYPTEYEATVPEDTPLHRSILVVTAEDADLGRNGEIYYSFLESTNQFAVHPITGIVSLTRPLRYVERAFHQLVVMAQDRGIGPRSGSAKPSTAKVSIRVKQVNLHSPEIYVQHLPDIVEHSNADIYAIVRVVDNDKGVHGEIKSLEIVDGDPDGHFRIRPAEETGGKHGEFNVEVLHLLDREVAPQGYNLTLRATDGGIPPRQSYKSVPVHLTDLNDNAPVFDREIYEVEIPETAPVNSPVICLKVTDADEGRNARVFLEIVGGNEGGEFRINPDSGMLYTTMALDAEVKAFYTLTVSAIDQGNAGTRKQSSAKVKINVVDTNDNDPVFESMDAMVWVDENQPAGASVTKVTAKDQDSLDNAYISYSIANLNPVPFDIDHFSGVIRTTSVLDYESTKRTYVLRIRASDWGVPFRRQTEMQLRISVKDVNDNRPQFEKVDCVGHVPRYIPIGTEIITLSAIDFDAGNIISYRILSGNEDGCFSLDTTSGVLSVTCDLADLRAADREVNVTATDGTHFADTARVLIHLVSAKRSGSPTRVLSDDTGGFECRDTGVARRLTEILASAERNNMQGKQEEFAMMPSRYGQNVHAPEFIEFPVEIRVNESVSIGTTLLRIRARDRDLGYNGKLVFGISSGDEDSVFHLDAETGELKVVGHLDREKEQEYLLNISVYDLGRPQKSSSKYVAVTVLDVNDNPPRFEKSVASFRVTENAVNGTAIFRLNATDADSGDNARVSFSMVTDTSDFSVDPATGMLSVSSSLDRERQETYELRLRATDRGSPPLHSDALVRVAVDDSNDNAPSFPLPSYTVRVREDVPPGSLVAIVSATDPDLGASGEVWYSEAPGGDGDGAFVVDRLSGAVRTSGGLDFEERQVHSLVVLARDRGMPSLSSEATVIVEVVDVNENLHAPRFEEYVVAASVKENQPVGTLVTTVHATDEDPAGDDSRVGYFIKGGDGMGLFSIDNEGNIRTMAVLDAESKQHYWLTVVARDHAVVPLHSALEVFVRVLDENDNAPLTAEPVYYPSVPENSPAGRLVLQLTAQDRDLDPDKRLGFRIAAGNPESFFSIDPDTGAIRTTGRRLDRENQAEHILEVTVSDLGQPPLSSSTRVVVAVEDVNDHAPQFDEALYKVAIPESGASNLPLFQSTQNDSDDAEIGGDLFLDNETWESFEPSSLTGEPVFRVLAFDPDIGRNGEITYSIKSGRGMGKFKIHPETGVVYSQRGFQAGQEYDLRIRAEDNGQPRRSHTTRVSVQVVGVPQRSPHPPTVRAPAQEVEVMERDAVGFLVALVQASDEDGDMLWYNIAGGDERNEFFIGHDKGNILLAKQLDWEKKNKYNLTISVTDGRHTVFTQVLVTVLDNNDHRPVFSERLYSVDISENVPRDTRILQLRASDRDEDQRLFYSLHAARDPASLQAFRVDSVSGDVYLNETLDRETIEQHLLTVMVRDHGTPSKRNYARVKVTVHDHNDHAPEFTSHLVEGKVFETAEVGSAVARLFAVDRDRGDNARVTYSITSGNVGNVFGIDASLGTLYVAKPLDMGVMSEYMVIVKATDAGSPALSSTVHVHIMVTMADNAPPRFLQEEHAAEIYENQPAGSFVKHLEARSMSSLFFEVVGGDDDGDGAFLVNPSTGVVTTRRPLDYERSKFYNLTVEATNMAAAKARCCLIVHVLDRNDNAPRFVQAAYAGAVSESAAVGSLVLANGSEPLVVRAEDADSELNALLSYDIVEALPRRFFRVDSSTGAIRTVMELDHETFPEFDFHVKVSDLGKPRLSSEATARVRVSVLDVNDCTPEFASPRYGATVLLPTYRDVSVLSVSAADADSPGITALRYDIVDGNAGGLFAMDAAGGTLSVADPAGLTGGGPSHALRVRVSDGKFSSVARVDVRVESSGNSGLRFQKDAYEGAVVENSTKVSTVAVVNVLGSVLNEHVVFAVLNPTDMFAIGPTSGAVRTTGRRFDRETKDHYELIVQARSDDSGGDSPNVAHVVVNITILDINDNCPMFVNLPYYAVVSVDAMKGDFITKVHAVDSDKGENGEVRYELIKGHGELFKVSRKTGEVQLKQNLDGHNRGLATPYELIIAAYDGGITPCSTEVPVHVKVIDQSMPVFDKQFYADSVPENIELHSPLAVSVRAESPLGRKLIYSIVEGNDFEEFALDFNTAPDSNNGPCVISVVDELDFEQKREYELTIRATDSVSGVHAEVPVRILVRDVNDCPPEFTDDSYNVSVSEAAPFGTSVLKILARDNDTGMNQQVRYEIVDDGSNSTEYFHVDPDDGSVYLKQSLDHELRDSHHFTVAAFDSGAPVLSSTAHVWVSVLDMNDNPPQFEQPSYTCFLSEQAGRGQFVTVVSASDPDLVDLGRLAYTVVGGNEQQTFSIDARTGIISLTNLQNFAAEPSTVLNVSVSDGVYTSFARVRIEIQPANRRAPAFPQVQVEARVAENSAPGAFVAKVVAADPDLGPYGEVTYSIPSDLLKESFQVDKWSGEMVTKRKLDREERKLYEVPVMATDGGGRSGFTTVRVSVLDENDNAPRFVLWEYKATIRSNLTTNWPFLKVRATDDDVGSSAEVEYSIYETQSSGVKELFGINSRTGDIFLLKSVLPWENQVFQFFVRAQDKGPTSLHADVPIDVFVMGRQDTAPLFQRTDEKFFIPENSPPGTIITRLKTVTNATVRYRLVSGDGDAPLFGVDGGGRLTVLRGLDRESTDAHVIGVLAETDSSPPLTALAEVSLKILDDNDNAPEFESNPYRLTLAENTEEGTAILKVIAHDRDEGSNGEVRYSFGSDVGELADVFAVNAYTGWVTTLVRLDREARAEYSFQVVATDGGGGVGGGGARHFARAGVHIRLQDYNDNPPVFTKPHYVAAVNEDALPGTVVVQLGTTDADTDLPPGVEYHVVGGDPRSQFQIRQAGAVYVSRPLDREAVSGYSLDVAATDGKFTAVAKVTIDILDANDNPPYCLKYRYREVLSEGTQPGSYVLTVLASDADEEPNANLRFYLTGDGSDYFTLDKSTGQLRTARGLDRERQSKYQLEAHVQDKDMPGWECSSQLQLVVSDLNDNAPEFGMPAYSATLAEDVEVGTLVTKVHATDVDIGINRKIRYVFVDSAGGHFNITADSGIVTLARPLDRETRAYYNLSVRAVDQGAPQLSKVVPLRVVVLDINDNPPEFTSKYYHARVPEATSAGSEVARVLATSKDAGVNAEVYYSIIGGNEHKKFRVDAKTGVISIAEPLDYERAKDYYLTLQAVDGGVPPLSNHAAVNITVLDSNDNAPMFGQQSYSARIREDAQVSDKILQVVANDLDSGQNGKIGYSIERGDRHRQFAIDEKTGYISVAGVLDREMISSYVLEVHARDKGVPVLSSYVMVNIEISDANDNPPVFSQPNYTAIVQEDKPVGHVILRLQVSDADVAPNAAPYTFDISTGDGQRAFRLEQDGALRTAAKLSHKAKDSYALHVRVFDNGAPPLSSDTFVVVKIIEESRYPPVVTPLEVHINSFMDEFPGGVVGRVHATDQDQYDQLSYGLVDASPGGAWNAAGDLFEVDRSDGTLSALPRLDAGEYLVNVSVTDGKFTSFAPVRVSVEMVSEEMARAAVAVTFRDVSPLGFLLGHRKAFARAVRAAAGASADEDVVVISVQPSGDARAPRKTRGVAAASGDLDVLFAVRDQQPRGPSSGAAYFLPAKAVRQALARHLEEIELATGLAVAEVAKDKCTDGYCSSGTCEDRVTLDTEGMTPVATDWMSFVSPRHRYKVACLCKEGYAGDRCETAVNECARQPCASFKVCVPDVSATGYTCQCPEGFAGAACEVDISRCHDESCYIPRNPVSFGGRSYAQYSVAEAALGRTLEEQLSLSLRIRTVQPTGNLMYAAGRFDYNILEVVNGVVQYRFDLGSGEGVVRVGSVYVSDGAWHEVCVERDGNGARVAVDGRHVAHGSAPGASSVLNLQSGALYLGAEVRQHPAILGFEDVQRGFVGCLDDARVARLSVPLHVSGAGGGVVSLRRFADVEFSCDTAVVLVPLGACGSQPCANGGTCRDLGGDAFRCECHARFAGTTCGVDTDPCYSSPCLHGGRCRPGPARGDYTCDCPAPMVGKRCEYGRHCIPNPCRNGGACEEGDSRAVCRCSGFTGENCAVDVDECEGSPCLNGATCVNAPGDYRCVCPPDHTGADCAEPLHSTAISSSVYSVTWEEVVGIAVALVLILSAVLLFVLYRRFRAKRSRGRADHINNDMRKDIVLNSSRPNDNDFKRGSKLSNLEVTQVPPQCAPRPASYTPSSNNEPPPCLLNNLDTLRSYGSAGDELEGVVPPDYLRNLNRNAGASAAAVASGGVAAWPDLAGHNQLGAYADGGKIKNDLKLSMAPDLTRGIVTAGRAVRGPQGPQGGGLGAPSSTSISSIDEDPRMVGGYHWDCSDWVNRSQNPLPNITEVPGSEVPDSSSFHSNESNESNTRASSHPAVLGPVDPLRDIETLNEDQESEYVGDSECGTEEFSDGPYARPGSLADSGGEEYRFSAADSYLRHPNTYLPRYVNSETEAEPLDAAGGSEDDDDDGASPYGFPSGRRWRDEDGSVVTVLGERTSLLGGGGGGTATSNSDLSTNLCELDDSECEGAELKRLDPRKRWFQSGVTQTSV